MIQKIALYVCPVVGCAKIGTKDAKCPSHQTRSMQREVYVHQRSGDVMQDAIDLAAKVDKMFGDKRPRSA